MFCCLVFLFFGARPTCFAVCALHWLRRARSQPVCRVCAGRATGFILVKILTLAAADKAAPIPVGGAVAGLKAVLINPSLQANNLMLVRGDWLFEDAIRDSLIDDV